MAGILTALLAPMLLRCCGGGDGREPLTLGGGVPLVRLTAALRAAGGSPRLPVAEVREIARVPLAGRRGRQAFPAPLQRRVEGPEVHARSLAFRLKDRGNRLAWRCDLDARRVTDVDLEMRVPRGRGPVHLLWGEAGDAPDTWRYVPFLFPFGEGFRGISVPVGESAEWRGRVVRMGLAFGVPPLALEQGGAVVEIRAIRFLRMTLGTRFARAGREPSIRRASIQRESREVVHAPAPSRLAVAVELPPRTRLEFAVGVHPSDYGKPGDGLTFRISFREDGGGGETILYTRTLDAKARPGDRRWFDESVDLASVGGRRGDLVFETLAGADARFDDGLWAHPTLIPAAPPPGPPSLLIVSLDTVRADHLGCYGYPRATSPVLDRLASESVLFEQAYAQAPETVASHMSLFTSLYPTSHGIVGIHEGKVLHPGIPTLAQVLAEGGYATAAFTEGGGVSSLVGFDRGFDRYADGPLRGPRGQKKIELTIGAAGAWLRRNAGRRFFLFVHTYEVHTPYDPPPPLDRAFAADAWAGGGGEGGVRPPFDDADAERLCLARRVRPESEAARRVRALYDGGIRHADAQLGRLLAGLDRHGLRERTVVVVLSDHGEDLLDHFGLATHGHTLYEELVRVPLLVRLPGGREGRPLRIPEPVSLVDLMPTLLDLFGFAPPPGLQGTSLRPLLEGGGGGLGGVRARGPVFFEDLTGLVRTGVRIRGRKLVESPGILEDPVFRRVGEFAGVLGLERFRGIPAGHELFDLDRDPAERRNLWDDPGGDRPREIARILEEHRRRTRAERREPTSGAEVDAETLRQLHSLGYLDGPDAPSEGPDGDPGDAGE